MHSRKMKEAETDEKLLALQYRFLLLRARFLIRNSLCLCVCVCVSAPIAVEILCVCVCVCVWVSFGKRVSLMKAYWPERVTTQQTDCLVELV